MSLKNGCTIQQFLMNLRNLSLCSLEHNLRNFCLTPLIDSGSGNVYSGNAYQLISMFFPPTPPFAPQSLPLCRSNTSSWELE